MTVAYGDEVRIWREGSPYVRQLAIVSEVLIKYPDGEVMAWVRAPDGTKELELSRHLELVTDFQTRMGVLEPKSIDVWQRLMEE